MSNRCRIYARVSSDKQKQDGTITNQTSTRVLQQIKRAGLDFTGAYDKDEGKSASKGKLHLRGDFQKMLVDAAAREFDVLWVADLDRMTRTNDWTELGLIFGPLQKAGIKIAGPFLPPMDLGDSMSMVLLILMIGRAYDSNERRKQGFHDGKQETADRGGYVQGTMPYGLTYRPTDKVRDGRHWGKDESKASIVRELYRRAVAGESVHSIAQDFERQNIRGPNGGRWSEAAVRILRSPVYRGVYHWNDTLIPVPPIVDEATWRAAQVAVTRSKKRGLGKPKGLYLCYQLAVCTVCGSPINVRFGEGAKGSTFRQYQCRNHSSRRHHSIPRCPLPVFAQERADALIWEKVRDFLYQPTDRILHLLRGKQEELAADTMAWASDVQKYAAQLAALADHRKSMIKMLKRGLLTEEEAMEEAEENAAEKARVEAQLAAAQNAVEGTSADTNVALNLERQIVDLRELANTADDKQRRELVRRLVAKGGITFDSFGANVRLAFGPGEPGKIRQLPETITGTCEGSLVMNPSQVPVENTVMLRVVIG